VNSSKLAASDGIVELHFGRTPLIDLTVQTKLRALQNQLGEARLLITGLEEHTAFSSFAHSTKVLKI
jgi:hypothetical protein